MADPSETRPLPLTQVYVQSLVRYADAMNNASTWNQGMNISAPHSEEVRALALRISQFSTEGRGKFSESDVQLLSEVGDGLPCSAPPLLAHADVPPEQKEHAQFRLGLGNAILEVRERLQQYVKAQLRRSTAKRVVAVDRRTMEARFARIGCIRRQLNMGVVWTESEDRAHG